MDVEKYRDEVILIQRIMENYRDAENYRGNI